MLAIQRVKEFSLPQELVIEKARLNQALKAFAREHKPLRVNGACFPPGQEREANIALANALCEKPFRAGVYVSEGQTRYVLGTIGHSFEVDGITVSLITDIRTNSESHILSSFSVYVFDGQPKPFVDVFLDGIETVASLQYLVFKVARATYSAEEIISHFVFLCALKEFFKARVHLRLSGQSHPLLEPLSYIVPSAWAVPLHEFALEVALDQVPNKRPFLEALGVTKDKYPFDANEASLQEGSACIVKDFCDHASLNLASLVSFGHLQLLHLHLFGTELILH